MECAVKFNVSSTIIVLFQFKEKLKKPQNLENGEFDEKSAGIKKDVKHDFTYIGSIKYPVSSTI